MDKDKKLEFYKNHENSIHFYGRLFSVISFIILLAIPFIMGIILKAPIDLKGFLAGYTKVALIYIPIEIVEFLIYVPILGAGGAYIAFITGNVTNMKIPCVMNAKSIAGTTEGTIEHEVVSTISITVSAITTMLVLVAGVVLLVPLTPILQNPVLIPAFDNIVPALFGALGFKYFVGNPKIAALPLAVMIILCIIFPSLIAQTSLMIIPAGAMAIVIAYILYRMNKLD